MRSISPAPASPYMAARRAPRPPGISVRSPFPRHACCKCAPSRPSESVGYGATWIAPADSRIAIVNLGYADGYLRCHAGRGGATWNGAALPLVGRVSMDLLAFDAGAAAGLGEGDWLALDYDLAATAAQGGLSQYELLTSLGSRFERYWD